MVSIPLKEEDTVFLYGMKPLDTQKCQSKNCPKLTPSNKKKGTTTDLPTNPFFQDSQGVKYPNL